MATFSDYAFYRDEFHGKLTEEAYDASVEAAHMEILSQTNGRANSAPVEMQRAVKLCECELVDVIDAYKQSAAVLPAGVASVSNDGYSVTAATGQGSSAKAEAQDRKIVCTSYLQYPVNLMSRWA